MAIIVRTDLDMSPGKIAAQCSHAVLQLLLEQMSTEQKTVPVFLVDEMTKKIGPTYPKDVIFKTMMFDPNSLWHKWTEEITTIVVLAIPSLEAIYKLQDEVMHFNEEVPFTVFSDNYYKQCAQCFGSGLGTCAGEICLPCSSCGGTGQVQDFITTCMVIGPTTDTILAKLTGQLQKL